MNPTMSVPTPICVALSSSLLVLASAPCQSPANLIGVTRNSPLIAQNQHGACTLLPNCAPTGMPPSTFVAWAGGTAWDPATNTVWVTTGQLLGRYTMNGCGVSCPPAACPKSSPLAEATGLDVFAAANELWVIDDAGWITRCTNACPPVVITSCNTGLALAGFTATTGIAVDGIRGLVFYSTADFAAGTGTIYAATLANPCVPFQAVAVFDCFNNPNQITGIAVDAANAVLYWTNGRSTFDWSYSYNPSGPAVAFTPGTCCVQAAPLPDPYTDLSIRWGAATSTGAPCANGACPACPMSHVLRNAPLLGTTLQLGLDLAPVSVPAWCVIGLGPCLAIGPMVPPLCGPVLVPLPAAGTLGLQFTAGSSGSAGTPPCNGSTTFLLPLPPNSALAGTVLSSQCVTLCVPTGTALSNCLSWTLQ